MFQLCFVITDITARTDRESTLLVRQGAVVACLAFDQLVNLPVGSYEVYVALHRVGS